MTQVLKQLPIDKFTKTEINILEKTFTNDHTLEHTEKQIDIYAYFINKDKEISLKLYNENKKLSLRIIKITDDMKENKKNFNRLLKTIDDNNSLTTDNIYNLETKLIINNTQINKLNNNVYLISILISIDFLLIFIILIILFIIINPDINLYDLFESALLNLCLLFKF
jgi:hypothetical protein